MSKRLSSNEYQSLLAIRKHYEADKIPAIFRVYAESTKLLNDLLNGTESKVDTPSNRVFLQALINAQGKKMSIGNAEDLIDPHAKDSKSKSKLKQILEQLPQEPVVPLYYHINDELEELKFNHQQAMYSP